MPKPPKPAPAPRDPDSSRVFAILLQRDPAAELAALIAEHLRLSRNSFKLGHRLRGLPDPDLPDLREQAAAEVYEAFQLSGPEDPAIDPAARDLLERIQAMVLANDCLKNAPARS